MGARVIRSSNLRQRNRREWRVVITIIASTILPLTLAYILVTLDIRPDLSDMKARKPTNGNRVEIVGWSALKSDSGRRIQDRSQQEPLPGSAARVRMMGYMMDGDESLPDGAIVSKFVLMSDAGQLLHPAHLEPSHMVEVWLQHPVPFEFRKLIWASGFLSRADARPRYAKPAWKMTDAHLEPASSGAILRWFEP